MTRPTEPQVEFEYTGDTLTDAAIEALASLLISLVESETPNPEVSK